MKYKWHHINSLLMFLIVFLNCSMVQGYNKISNTGLERNMVMKTYYIGRFSIAVPSNMTQDERTSKLRYVEINEVILPRGNSHDQACDIEWHNFMSEIRKLAPPKGTDRVIIKMSDFPRDGKWIKGVFYYCRDDGKVGRWALLFDSGTICVWLKTCPVVVQKELVSNKSSLNLENIAKSYMSISLNTPKIPPSSDRFYLNHGAINLPYSVQEASFARFKNNSLDLTLTINMEMDSRHKIETLGLIEKTKGMLAAAALQTSGSISKIRLNKREVAGMKGEESILRITEDSEKTLLFTWEFNGKEDSGEYPTTTIKMESPDGKLDEKIRIWDAVLDSMKPMFERKK